MSKKKFVPRNCAPEQKGCGDFYGTAFKNPEGTSKRVMGQAKQKDMGKPSKRVG